MEFLPDPAYVPTTKDLRDAAVASVLADGYRGSAIPATDAMRVIRHEMRRRNVNKKEAIRPRSQGADEVIRRYRESGLAIPKNGSPDALHADHVHPITVADLDRLITPADWLAAMPLFWIVVCVTAAENYRLEVVEKAGTTGPEKYAFAGIEWAS